MDLRELQRPLKEQYRADPASSRITLTAKGGEAAESMPTQCSVDLGRALYEAQAHPGVGGPGTGACSGDLLLGALAACAQLTCQMVATAMGLDVRRIEIVVEGDLDLRGTLGIDREVSAGFDAIRGRYRPPASGRLIERLKALFADRQTWKDLGWLLLLLPVGITGFTVAVVAWCWTLYCLAFPLFFKLTPAAADFGDFTLDTWWWAALVFVIGLVT